MRSTQIVSWLAVGLLASGSGARAADKFHITAAERAACGADAAHFCLWSYPDEDKLLTCMRQNRADLSMTCRIAFDAGIRRRHL